MLEIFILGHKQTQSKIFSHTFSRLWWRWIMLKIFDSFIAIIFHGYCACGCNRFFIILFAERVWFIIEVIAISWWRNIYTDFLYLDMRLHCHFHLKTCFVRTKICFADDQQNILHEFRRRYSEGKTRYDKFNRYVKKSRSERTGGTA